MQALSCYCRHAASLPVWDVVARMPRESLPLAHMVCDMWASLDCTRSLE